MSGSDEAVIIKNHSARPVFSTQHNLTDSKPPNNLTSGDPIQSMLFLPGIRELEGGFRLKERYKQSLPGKPLVSIITVVFNGETFIEETIRSVLGQTYDNIEYIILDGGSTDSTVDLIQKYDHAVDYWVSEPDDGIYDAMNKGIRLASGEIIGILNADDIFYPNAVEAVVEQFLAVPNLFYTFGDVDRMNENGIVFGRKCHVPEKELNLRIQREMPIPHLSLFAGKKLYNEIGLFDCAFDVSADYDLVFRILESGLSGSRVDEVIGAFRTGGQSGGLKTYLEARSVQKKHGINVLKREWNLIRSLVFLFTVNILPFDLVKWLRKFRRKSVNKIT